ncbi:hypothetical protein DFH09DRAFT_1081804 [Mycena vulgaris]|nr:hypothetical protein DFH09DRAFT_1081804 [Mycena vulgaris]
MLSSATLPLVAGSSYWNTLIDLGTSVKRYDALKHKVCLAPVWQMGKHLTKPRWTLGKGTTKLLPATRGRVAEESIVSDKIYQVPQPGPFNLLQVKAEPMSLWLSWFTASSKNTSKLEVVKILAALVLKPVPETFNRGVVGALQGYEGRVAP